jgi:hypothetical protein
MKIIEIINEAETNTPASQEISQRLINAGYKQLGPGGADSTVWKKDEGNIIKIIMTDPAERQRIDAEDSFIEFYNYVQSHNKNPHLPKFVKIQGQHYSKFNIGEHTYMQVAMEHLQPIVSDKDYKILDWMSSDTFSAFKRPWESELNTLKLDWDDLDTGTEFDPVRLTNRYRDLDLYNTAKDMRNSTNRRWDLHPGNVMLRGNVLVIIDPWY